jgi:hypothetical protein
MIPSFKVDHTKLKPGLYVSRVDKWGMETKKALASKRHKQTDGWINSFRERPRSRIYSS